MGYNILHYGASVANENNAPFIQKAIDDCAQNGGGRVIVPAGRFVSGTVRLKSHVELHLERGAMLKGSTDPSVYNELEEYPQNFFSTGEGWDYRHLIIAHCVQDVGLSGFGVIEGCADYWFDAPQPAKFPAWRAGVSQTKGYDGGALRFGQLIVFVECSHVSIKDITVQKSSAWTVLLHGCEHVQIDGAKISNDPTHLNTDCFDIDSCRYVTVSNCILETGDDCFAIRGNAVKLSDQSKPCEYVTITNCVLSSSADAFRIGVGVGAVRHLRVSNIVVRHAGRLIDFNTSYLGRGHCELEDINFSNISATDVGIPLGLCTDDVSVRDVTVENIRVEAMCGIRVVAEKSGSMENISLRNIDLKLISPPAELTDEMNVQRGEYMLLAKNISKLSLYNIDFIADGEMRRLWSGEMKVENCSDK